MGASIAGIPFKVNPESVSWKYQVKIADHRTVGGKVIQLYGFNMTDLTITGHFGGPDAVQSQHQFFEVIKDIATAQSPQVDRTSGDPVRLLWPEQGWDFWVFILSLKQAGAGVAIETREEFHAPKYQLVCFVYEDNGDILRSATGLSQAKFLSRLTAGLGWQQTSYNGPETIEEVAARLGGTSILDFAFQSYGLLPSTDEQGAEYVSNEPSYPWGGRNSGHSNDYI
jgi:hypothetical protein